MVKRLAVLATALLAGLSTARAESPVPSDGVITSSGEYFLTGNRSSTGTYNIQINANNVDLDLRGFTVTCNPSDPATATTFGILIPSGEAVTIRNGKITGCFMGVHAGTLTDKLTVRSVDFTGNTAMGVNAGGRDVEISDSIFADIGGYSLEGYAVGINNPGSDCILERNVFRNIYGQTRVDGTASEGVAVLFGADTSNCVARHNWLENDELGPVSAIAFWTGEAKDITITENTVTNFGRGVAGAAFTAINNRFWMRDAETASNAIGGPSGFASGNVIVGYDEPIHGYVTASDNLILP